MQPETKIPASSLRLVVRLMALLLMVSVIFPMALLMWTLALERPRRQLTRIFYNMMRRISGVRLTVEGEISKQRPMMMVANHSSYLDIFVLGSTIPVSFTPKLEIRSWPIIGFFCVLGDCVFIERRPADMQRAQAEMANRMKDGKVLVLFPEGTTGDGINVKPFKSGFLNLVESQDIPLQPVSLAYTHIGEVPLNARNREKVAWIGEASFVTHFFRLMRYPYVRVTARYYPIQRRADHGDRKEMAKACEVMIATGLKEILEANHVFS